MTPPYQLRRYTHVSALRSIFADQRMRLGRFKDWEDKNDSHYVEAYRREGNFTDVRILCLSAAEEDFHHWRSFAFSPDGVLIVFNGTELHNALLRAPRLVAHGPMEYHWWTGGLKRLKRLKPDEPPLLGGRIRPDRLPFVKRKHFQGEREYRYVFGFTDSSKQERNVDVPTASIARVWLSPWSKASSLHAIRRMPGANSIQINRSKLLNNKEWRALADRSG
ncbi:MAG: hypothetical protein WEG36_12205 [Gemmatimonadota bacterium]